MPKASSFSGFTVYYYPGCAHNGAGSFSFADGHVEGKKWLDPRTTRRG